MPDLTPRDPASNRMAYVSVAVGLVVLVVLAFVLSAAGPVNPEATARCRDATSSRYCSACCAPYLSSWGIGFSHRCRCTTPR